MNILRKAIHKVEHFFGMNAGDIVTWREGDSVMISFKCKACGKIDTPIEHFKLNTIEKEPNYDDNDTNP